MDRLYFSNILMSTLVAEKPIKNCWEASRELANPTTDVTYDAIDAALEPFGLSFEDAYLRMRGLQTEY